MPLTGVINYVFLHLFKKISAVQLYTR